MRSWIQVDAEDFRQRHETCGVRPVRVHRSLGTLYPDAPWRAGCSKHGYLADSDGKGPFLASWESAMVAADAHLKAKHGRGDS